MTVIQYSRNDAQGKMKIRIRVILSARSFQEFHNRSIYDIYKFVILFKKRHFRRSKILPLLVTDIRLTRAWKERVRIIALNRKVLLMSVNAMFTL